MARSHEAKGRAKRRPKSSSPKRLVGTVFSGPMFSVVAAGSKMPEGYLVHTQPIYFGMASPLIVSNF